jgi:hypothetical protein
LLCKGRSETFTAAGAPRTSPETWSGSAEAPAGARRQTARAAGSKEWEYIRSLLDKMIRTDVTIAEKEILPTTGGAP